MVPSYKKIVRNSVIETVAAAIDDKIGCPTELSERMTYLWDALDDSEALAIHQAQHFISDADIRLRDSEYAKSQRQSLEKDLQELRNKQINPEETCKILLGLIRTYVRVQRKLLAEFFRCNPKCKDMNSLSDFPMHGEIQLDNQTWNFRRHGVGLAFMHVASGADVDAHKWIDRPSSFDVWRLDLFLMSIGLLLEDESTKSDVRKLVACNKVLENDGRLTLRRSLMWW